ncbi:MAG TPA: hypothetical protein PKC21_01885 [Oligoflexia bacterium]|nr:hypothetical protein [Oligoflexia bacterium]HMR24081.1 hypothetical protein [Oligoflexia bacterium]
MLIASAYSAEQSEFTIFKAKSFLEEKNYFKAINELEKPLNQMKINNIDQIVEANLIMGFSYCELGQFDKMESFFNSALTYQYVENLDKFDVSKQCKRKFKQIQKSIASPTNKLNLKPYEPKKDIKRYLPYGIGHFKRGNKKKGKFFAISEGALTTIAITSAILFASEDTIGGRHYNPGKAKRYQTIFWSAVGANIGLVSIDLFGLK